MLEDPELLFPRSSRRNTSRTRRMTSCISFLRKAANQLIPIFLLIGALLLNYFLVEQRMPGFIVGDPTLSYPILEETLSTIAAAGIMFLYPFIALVLHCIIIGRQLKHYNKALLIYWWDKTWCAMFISFIFISLSEFLKRFVGRLRPNFFAMCDPEYDVDSGMTVGDNQLYITEYVCTNDTSGESGRSFPSGHSVFAVLLFSAMGYLLETHQSEDKVSDPTWALRVALQMILTLIVGPALGLTRYTEYFHHAFDVIVGIILGYFAFFCLFVLERIFVTDPRSPTGVREQSSRLGKGSDHDVEENIM